MTNRFTASEPEKCIVIQSEGQFFIFRLSGNSCNLAHKFRAKVSVHDAARFWMCQKDPDGVLHIVGYNLYLDVSQCRDDHGSGDGLG